MKIEINNWEYEDDVHEQQFYFSSKLNDDIIGCIVTPHKGNGNMWLMRIGFRSTFDNWGNVELHEKFLTSSKPSIL